MEYKEAVDNGIPPVGVIVKPIGVAKIPKEMTDVWQITNLTFGGDKKKYLVAPPPERRETSVEFSSEELKRLRAGLAKLGLVGFNTESFLWPPATDLKRAPYRGLRPLETDDAGVFFGRDADLVRARELLLSLRAQGGRRLFVILGASGAGKSSFLRAGLIPRLGREEREFLVLPVIRPAAAPMSGPTGLVASITEAFKKLRSRRSPDELTATVLSGPQAMPKLLADLQELAAAGLSGGEKAQVDRAPTLIFAIDQAEELYSADKGAEAPSFTEYLASAILRGPEAIALLTIRSDRFEMLQGLATLRDIPKEPFNLPPVEPFAFREAIVGPAAREDPPIEIEPDLVAQLLGDTAAQGADPLPLLAFTLERLYLNREKITKELNLDSGSSKKKLTLRHYTTLGGIKGSIEAALKEALADPGRAEKIPADPAQQERLLEEVFVPALVDINEENDEPLRRIASEGEIPAEGRGLVNRLVAARLLVRGSRKTARGAQTTFEVAHEALLRQWDALHRIIDRATADLKALQTVERAADAWEEHAEAADWLDHKGERLIAAERLPMRPDFAKRLAGVPAKYLTACRQLEEQVRRDRERTQRRARIAAYAVLVIGLLALGGALWQDRVTQQREASVLTSVAQRATGESQYERAMRAALQGLPGAFGLPTRPGWSAKEMSGLEAKLAGAAQGTSFIRELSGHAGAVRSVAFNRDGTRIVTASVDGTAIVWDAASGTALVTLRGHGDELRSASFSPDGTRIVTASADKTARIWNADNGRELLKFIGHTDKLFSAAFSPDGRRIVTASADKTARVWDATNGAELFPLTGHTDVVTSASFSMDGAFILTSSQDSTARIWDANSGKQLVTLSGHTSGVRSAAFSLDGKRVVTGSWDYSARVWDAKTGAQLLLLKDTTGPGNRGGQDTSRPVRCAVFSPDGKRILTASDDRIARVWDSTSGAALLRLIGHRQEVVGVAFSPDGTRIATASEDKTARIWDADHTAALLRLDGHAGAVVSAAFSPDGKRVVTAHADRKALVWDAMNGKELLQLNGHGDWVRSAAFSPDGKRIATASRDGTARVWDATTGSQLFEMNGRGGEVFDASFSPDGDVIATSSADGVVRKWDANNGILIGQFGGPGQPMWSAEFSPDGSRIVTASDDFTWRIWDAKTGALILQSNGHTDMVKSAVFSPDAARIVTASWDHKAKVWDASAGKELAHFPGDDGLAFGARFSPDGDRIATAFGNNTAWVWDAKSGETLFQFKGDVRISQLKEDEKRARSVAFSPNGDRIVMASEDGTARIWDAHWLVTTHGPQLASTICAELLVGDAQLFTSQDEADDPILSGLAGQNACTRHVQRFPVQVLPAAVP